MAKDEAPSGAPAWMATFADLVTLLMCFFILLLAFSEMDVQKYKSVSGSMRRAMGVKADSTEITLPDGDPADIQELRSEEQPSDEPPAPPVPDVMQMLFEQLQKVLEDEIVAGMVSLEQLPDKVVIRIHEHAAFKSGKARISKDFVETIHRVRDALIPLPGNVVVAGHTDNIPINGRRFRSNWDLSSARAASVVHELVADGRLLPIRVVAQGYADSRPLVPNDTRAHRAENRRVDIIMVTPQPPKPEAGGGPIVPADPLPPPPPGWLDPDSADEAEAEAAAAEAAEGAEAAEE